MVDFSGMPCPECESVFTEKDEIVVCPYCGAPYHRGCYSLLGHCKFEDKHNENYNWDTPFKLSKDPADTEIKTCRACSFKNSETAIFCEHCGFRLDEEATLSSLKSEKSEEIISEALMPNTFGQSFFSADPLGGLDAKEQIAGVSCEDLAKFVQNNSQYYLPVFKRIDSTKKSRFNFAGAIFPGIWFLYRKQYKFGTIFTFITILLTVLQHLTSAFFFYSTHESILKSLNISAKTIILPHAQMLEYCNKLLSLGWLQIVLYFSPLFLLFLDLILRLICGFSGNRLYMNHCQSKVKVLKRESKSNNEFCQKADEFGGTNRLIIWCFIACYFIIYSFPLPF